MNMQNKFERVLAVGMLPPPVGGQALMFKWAAEYLQKKCFVHVIDLQAQRNIGEAGSITLQKLFAFLRIIARSAFVVLCHKRYDILYYCPSGPSKIGIIKDTIILSLLRGRADKVVFHFHATGVMNHIKTLPPLLRRAALKAMDSPNLSIRCADVEPNDASLCHSERQTVVFNGIPDPTTQYAGIKRTGELHLCFIGAVTREKGVIDLLQAALLIKRRYPEVLIDIIGEGVPEFLSEVSKLVRCNGLSQNVILHGVKTGFEKYEILGKASLFVFPTYFRAETQPLAVIEAAAMGIPTVGSDWRGMNTIVEDGVTGRLSPPRDPALFAHRVIDLLASKELENMGRAARKNFVNNFTQEAFIRRFENSLNSLYQ